MNKSESNKFLIFLKLFFYMIIAIAVLTLLGAIIINSLDIRINLGVFSWYSFAFSITFSLLNVNKYSKYTAKLTYEESTNKDIYIEIQKVMKNMHWTMIKNANGQMIFKSSLIRTLWREHLTVTVTDNAMEIVGSKYFVNKLVNHKALKK